MPLEFKRYIEQHKPTAIRYEYDAQKWFNHLGTDPTFRAEFHNLSICINPTFITIHDRLPGNYIFFYFVVSVSVRESEDGRQAEYKNRYKSPDPNVPDEREFYLTVDLE